jgi:hypothetical protein
MSGRGRKNVANNATKELASTSCLHTTLFKSSVQWPAGNLGGELSTKIW